jgi:transposase InsO family protein
MVSEGHEASLCTRVLDVSRSGYYLALSRPPSARSIRHAWLTDVITQVHLDSRGTYGAPRVHPELRMGQGIVVGHNIVARLMRQAGLVGAMGGPKRRSRHEVPSIGDFVDRQFERHEPNQLWPFELASKEMTTGLVEPGGRRGVARTPQVHRARVGRGEGHGLGGLDGDFAHRVARRVRHPDVGAVRRNADGKAVHSNGLDDRVV